MRTYRPIEYRQVCAIARLVLLRAPTMTDADWKAATLDECARQGWDNPSADMLSRAMGAVERSLVTTIGVRPTTVASTAPESKPNPAPLTPRDWNALALTLAKVMERSAAARPSNIAPIARETLEISEMAALDQFYAEAASSNRIAVLRRFAEIAIVRPADWDPKAIRAEAMHLKLFAHECYGCRADRPLNWHHIIQIQHGGSNYARNRVAICDRCHSDVHPWLPKSIRVTAGFTSLAGLTPKVAALLRASIASKENVG